MMADGHISNWKGEEVEEAAILAIETNQKLTLADKFGSVVELCAIGIIHPGNLKNAKARILARASECASTSAHGVNVLEGAALLADEAVASAQEPRRAADLLVSAQSSLVRAYDDTRKFIRGPLGCSVFVYDAGDTLFVSEILEGGQVASVSEIIESG